MSFPRSRAGLWLVFFVNGAVLSSWAPRIPAVAGKLGISDAVLGVALLGIAIGAIPAMMLAAALSRRVGSGAVCLMSASVFAAGLPLIALTRSAAQLTVVLILLGAASGLLDIVMNTLGITLQRHRGAPLLTGLHSGYSLGVLAGSGGAVIATTLGAPVSGHFLAVAAILLVLTGVAAPAILHLGRLPDSAVGPSAPDTRRPRRRFQLGIPVSVVVLAVSGLLLEGLVTDWSALLLTRDPAAPASGGAIILTAFSLAMFTSRALTDRLLRRIPEQQLVTIGSLVTLAVAVIALLGANAGVSAVAIVVIGLTLGPVFPLAIARAAGAVPHDPALTTARVSILGYSAYLAGPPLIGALAQVTGLPMAFTATACAAGAGILLTARRRG